MIVDSSVVIALVTGERDQEVIENAMIDAAVLRVSAGSWIELTAVAIRKKIISLADLDDWRDRFNVVIEPVTIQQAHIGREAYRDFGQGSGHPARLNFGDCFSYALAKATGEPLLFKGDDFTHTDITPALKQP